MISAAKWRKAARHRVDLHCVGRTLNIYDYVRGLCQFLRWYFRVSPRLPFWMPCNATCCFQMKLFLVPQWVLVLMLASTSKPLNCWCFWSDGSYPEIDRIGLHPTFSQVFFFFCICWHCVLYIISFDACAHENPSLRKPKFGALRLLSWPSPDIMGSSPPMPPSIQQFLPRRKDCGR